MLPSNVLQALRFLCKAGYNVGAIPFVWDSSNNSVYRTKSKFRLKWALFISSYCFANFCFMTIRWFQAACCMDISYGRLFSNAYNIITHAGGSAFYFNTYMRGLEVQDFINHLMKTNDRFKKYVCPANYIETIKGGNIIKRVFIPIYCYSFIQFFVAINKNNNPKYVYSLFDLKGTAKWKLIPIGIFESYMSFCLGTSLLFYAYIYISYIRSTKACLTVLTSHKVGFMVKYYKQLQIVNSQFHNLCKTMILPATTYILLSLTIVSMYATIKLYHEVKLPAFLGFPLITSATFIISLDAYPQSYEIYELSEVIIKRNVQFVTRSKYNYKILCACPPLKIQIGTYYYVVRSTFFTFMAIVIDLTINAMLTF